MTREQALQIAMDNAVFDSVRVSLPCLSNNIVDAMMQVADAEREACAMIADDAIALSEGDLDWICACNNIADAIRERAKGEK